MKNQIIEVLNKVGAESVTFLQESDSAETIVSFVKIINGKEFLYLLLYFKEQEILVVNLLFSFEKFYENTDPAFHEVVNQLNETCIHGSVGFVKEETTQLTYKSSYMGDPSNLMGNKSFEYFLNVSFDMTDMLKLRII